jgi:transmembrane protein TMEM260 (protein O-mannosyltransferase)
MLMVFAAALALNLATAAPTVMEGDGAELQTVGALGGVAHPPGYPTWTLLARLFAMVWPGEPAHRVTALSAVAGAAALVVLMRVMERLGASRAAVLAGVVLAGASITFRWASIYPEVYAVAALLLLVGAERTLAALQKPSALSTLVAASCLTLAFTGYFAFAPALVVCGIRLLFRSPREPRLIVGRALTLLAGIVLGLTPYLYIVWADTSSLSMNYMKLVVDARTGMFGLRPELFDGVWERLRWLALGSDEAQVFRFYAHPRLFLGNAADAAGYQLLFEIGPAVLVLVPLGAIAIARRSMFAIATLASIGVLSFLFASSIVYGRLLLPFLMPLTLALAIVSAFGVESLASRWARGRGVMVVSLAIALVAALLPHAIRARAAEQPLGPRAWHFLVEGGPSVPAWPSFRDERGPRETGERALAAIPQGAYVIGRWRELMTLYYLRDVERRRRDLTFDPVYRGHELRYAAWQETHDLRERPFVLLGRIPGFEPYLGAMDSVAVNERLTLYVIRQPLRGLPAP